MSRIVTLLVCLVLVGAGCHKSAGRSGGKSGGGPKASLSSARQHAANHDVARASAAYERVLAKDPDSTVAGEYVAFLIDHNELDKAAEFAESFAMKVPEDDFAQHVWAEALLASGDFAGTLEIVEPLIEQDSRDAAAHDKRGRALLLAGDVEEALRSLKRAVDLDDQNPEYLVSLGSGHLRARDFAAAERVLRVAVKLAPDSGTAQMLLGMALRDQYNLDEAHGYLVRATKLAPSDDATWFELGVYQNLRGDNLGAEESLRKATQVGPHDSRNWYALGEVLRINKMYEDAIECYRAALDRKPPHPKAAGKLGIALYESGQVKEAEVFLTEAAYTDRSNAYNYLNLGVVYEQTKRYSLAIGAYEKFLELAPPEDGDRATVERKIKDLRRKR